MKVRLRAQAVWDRLAQRNMSQNDLARRLGITSGYLSLLINGKRYPSPRMRERIQAELGGDGFHHLFILEHPEDREGRGGPDA